MAEKTKNKKIGLRKSLPFYCIMLAWPVLQFCVFYIGVNFNSILLAFKSYDALDPLHKAYSFGFDNFAIWFDRTDMDYGMQFFPAIGVSFKAYLISLLVGVPLGLFFSYYIFKKLPGATFFRVVLFLPTIVSGVVLVSIYKKFMNDAVCEILAGWGLYTRSLEGALWMTKSSAFATVMSFNVFISFGTSVLMYSNKMATISPEIIESAQLDGAGAFKEFFHVVLPMAFSTVSVFLITGIAGIFTNQLNAHAFYVSGDKVLTEVQSIGYILYYKTRKAGQMSWQYGPIAALGVMLTAIVIPLTFGARYLFNRFGPSED